MKDEFFDFQKRLFELKDDKYAEFQAKLTPNVDKSSFIGVRVPRVRLLAKEIVKNGKYVSFINNLPHTYYDENMLHGVLLSEIKDYDYVISEVNKFLPYVDNWAVCDIMSPKCFKKNKDKLIGEIENWIKSTETYTIRFGIEMLMSHYLDDDFRPKYLLLPLNVKSDEYYVNMMIAWYYATSLSKKWDDTIKIIEENKLDKWVHNKTIQKACESYRITNDQKEYLRTLKK